MKNNDLKIEQVVEKMCHNPAKIFEISKRGFIKKGYWADLTIVDLNKKWTVNKENLLYKCAWSSLEGRIFSTKVVATIVNGKIVYKNENFNETQKGRRVEFERTL